MPLFLLLIMQSNAQNNIYSKIIFNPGDDILCYDMDYDFDTGFLLAGYHKLIKIDSAGDIVYSKRFSDNVEIRTVGKCSDSSSYMSGVIYNDSLHIYNLLITKTDSAGNLLFAKSFNTGLHLNVNSACICHNDGIAICGYVNSGTVPNNKMLVARFSSNGDLLWEKTFTGGNRYNYAVDIKQQNDSSFVVLGTVQNGSPLPVTTRASLIKLDLTGNLIQAYTFETSNAMHSMGFGILTHNQYLYCFISNNIIIKLNDSMQTDWCYSYNSFTGYGMWSYDFNPVKFHISSRGTIYHNGIGLNEIDTMGNEISGWDAFLETQIEILETPDKGFLIAGNGPMMLTKEKTLYMPHVGLIKSDSLGNTQNCAYVWYYSQKTPVSMYLTTDTIIEETSGLNSVSINVSYNSYPSFSDFGCVDVSGNEQGNSTENEFVIFPNPTNGIINISPYSQINSYTVKVIDIAGKTVMNALNCSSGQFDISGLNNGVYFIEININSICYHYKVVLMQI